MIRACLALGGNLGRVEQTFRRALEGLAALPETDVVSSSSVYCFPAVGSTAGSDFSNAAACIDTAVQPLELLSQLQRIENESGRVRDVRWGPRPLDLDLIFYGDEIVHLPQLIVPHPACWYRRFVLDPLNEIAPNTVHPEKGESVCDLRERLLTRPLPVVVAGCPLSTASKLIARLEPAFPEVAFSPGRPSGLQESGTLRDPAIWFWLSSGSDVDAVEFARLPVVPRLEIPPSTPDPFEFVRDVLCSALGR